MPKPRASVLIPTHNHHGTLPLAVRSVLNQTVRDFEILIIGDGATSPTEYQANLLVESDERVKYLNFPKGPGHGEIYRHSAIEQAASEYIFYLCDDDLFMPHHLENLLELLGEREFVQSRNGFFNLEGELQLYPTDLSKPEAISWHLKNPRRNFVSLTGTAHRRRTYFDLSEHWETTPEGEWPDHFMWKKFFRVEGIRAATHPEMTALQFSTSAGREEMTQDQRLLELRKWDDFLRRPDARETLHQIVSESLQDTIVELAMGNIDMRVSMTDGPLSQPSPSYLNNSQRHFRSFIGHLGQLLIRNKKR